MHDHDVRSVLTHRVEARLGDRPLPADRGSFVALRCAVIDAEADSLVATLERPVDWATVRTVHAQMIREAVLGRGEAVAAAVIASERAVDRRS
jgi:hypothetical protein